MMLEVFGQLINFWDGGGKGEKFVQEVKPLITRGVHDYERFFVIVMEKIYKHRLLHIFARRFKFFGSESSKSKEEQPPNLGIGPDGEIQEVPDLPLEEDFDKDYSALEDRHMSKLRSFYCYRSKQQLDDALEQNKPISGILVPCSDGDSILDFYVLYTQKRSHYWVKVTFDDSNGTNAGGLWYAPMAVTAPTQPIPESFAGIQTLAKMSTVAIPMSYGIGPGKPNSNKFCVITNWWKERQPNGRYSQPGLDASYYQRQDRYEGIMEHFADDAGAVI